MNDVYVYFLKIVITSYDFPTIQFFFNFSILRFSDTARSCLSNFPFDFIIQYVTSLILGPLMNLLAIILIIIKVILIFSHYTTRFFSDAAIRLIFC